MPKCVPIGIFNTARTVVDRAAVAKWLEFIGVSDEFELPDGDACTDPALLIALAAKRCYKAFEVNPMLNPNVTRIRADYTEYVDNILKSGHGSVLEHSVYTFAIENVSRVFTGEMNRHRAGWAISEGSMRFIRFGECIPYWLPDSIAGPDVIPAHATASLGVHAVIPERGFWYQPQTLDEKRHATRVVFDAAFAAQESAYLAMERIWADELAPESKFADKKIITSMMRRVVGMGVATGGVWTGNIRALRHVIAMRCSPAAEEEILHVFSRICMMMREMESAMFGDFHQNDQGYWVPVYPKV